MKPFEWLDPGELVDGDLQLVLVAKDPADPVKEWVPAYRFEMRLTGSQERLGEIDLRVGHQHQLDMYCGHLAYSVEVGHRGHHYAARACRLLGPLAHSHGLKTIWITCNPDNWASRRTCELAGAEFVEIVDLPEHIDMYREGERQKCRYKLEV